MNDYYVYIYLDPRKSGEFKYGNYTFEYEPFYVGKGTKSRYLRHLKETLRNPLKTNKIKKILDLKLTPVILKVKEHITNADALSLEIDLIKIIGKIINKTGPLTNISDGGETHLGYKHKNDYIQKLLKPVCKYDIDGNLLAEYSSVKEAGDKNNCDPQTISSICSGSIKIWKNQYIFLYKGTIFKTRIRDKKQYAVIRIDYNNIEKEYSSITQASMENNIGLSKINAVCMGNKFQSGGYLWKYKSHPDILSFSDKIQTNYGKYHLLLNKKIISDNNIIYNNILHAISLNKSLKINNLIHLLDSQKQYKYYETCIPIMKSSVKESFIKRTIEKNDELIWQPQVYNSKKKALEFVMRENYNDLVEDTSFVPRFSLKDVDIFKDMPVNEPVKFSPELIIKGIKYGCIFLFNYKGEKDKHFAGHERVCYGMVYGKSSKGKGLLRVYHLNGWSVSKNSHIQKIWRLFRTDRILSMTFTGSFYRLPPEGYNMNDKGMRGGISARADFNEIRRNQQNLVKSQVIQDKEDVTMSSEQSKFATVKVTRTDTILDLNEPFENAYVTQVKDVANLRISFLKSIYGNKYVAILGALGQSGNTVKILSDNTTLGVYKVLDSITGDVLKKIKNIKGNAMYDLYIFDKKV